MTKPNHDDFEVVSKKQAKKAEKEAEGFVVVEKSGEKAPEDGFVVVNGNDAPESTVYKPTFSQVVRGVEGPSASNSK